MTDIYHEKILLSKGYKVLAGVDEVGRGCLFGDVVACACSIDLDHLIRGVRDSKKLSPKKRESLYDEILKGSFAVGFGRVDPGTIDKINIKEASRLAMKRAVLDLKTKDEAKIFPDALLIDAESIDLNIPQINLVHGDDLSYSIACASILAKVYRDRLCLDWANEFPGYSLERNKGYGTKAHRESLIEKGPTPMHRKSFLGKILGELR